MTELRIERLAYGGNAIAHLPDGKVAFVTGACPGDVVDADITAVHAKHAEAVTQTVIEPSPSRVKPPCPYFGECGGCQWQHVDYSVQLAAKRDAVIDALTRIGDQEQGVTAPTIASPDIYGYRNKVELLGEYTIQGLALGYARAKSHDLIQVDTCHLLPGRLRKAPKALRGALRYASGDSDLGITRVALRAAVNTRDVEIAIWGRPGPFPRGLTKSTLADSVKASSVVRVLTKDRGQGRAVSDVEVLKGKGAWRERLEGHSMLVSAPSFFQVNTKVAEMLVTLVMDALALEERHRVLDLYSGVGTFTLPIAQIAEETVAVESSRFAIGDLRRNAENAGVYVDIVGGDAAREIAELGQFDRVVVDPPRTGLGETTVRDIAQTTAERIVYVSCDPTTLARDVGYFAGNGYSLSSATPVDLFPQTYHVETVAVLDRVR